MSEKVIGISMVKDEADIIEHTIKHMLTQVDHILIADNKSTDGTYEILDSIADSNQKLSLVEDYEQAYYQSRKMTALAREAYLRFDADWVISFDSDEIWMPTDSTKTIKEALQGLSGAIVRASIFDYVRTAKDDYSLDIPFQSMVWRKGQQEPLYKVACRPTISAQIEQGNHGVQYNTECYDGLLYINHFPYRSAEQMIRKVRNGAAAYKLTNLHPSLGDHWRRWGELDDDELQDVYYKELYSRDPNFDGLVYDPV